MIRTKNIFLELRQKEIINEQKQIQKYERISSRNNSSYRKKGLL